MRTFLFLALPLLVAACLYSLLRYPTVETVQAVFDMEAVQPATLDPVVKALEKAVTPVGACSAQNLVEPIASVCGALKSIKALIAGQKDAASVTALKAKLESESNQFLLLLAAQLAALCAIIVATASFVVRGGNYKGLMRFLGLYVIFVAVLFGLMFLLAGKDIWEQSLVSIASAKLEAAYPQAPVDRIVSLASISLTLFAGTLALITLVVALLGGSYPPPKTLYKTFPDELEKAEPMRRIAIIRGMLGLAALCFVLTVAVVGRLTSLGLLLFAPDQPPYKLIETMAASVKVYWSAGLSLLLAIIFVPPVAHLLSYRERKADTPGTGYVFIDILGDDTTKKVVALVTLAAPLLFPLLEKAL